MEHITVLNVLNKSSHEVATYLNSTVLASPLPQYSANHTAYSQEIAPLLPVYANNKAFVTSLYLIVYSAYYTMKIAKSEKSDGYSESKHKDLEAASEILLRTIYALDALYASASRMLTTTLSDNKSRDVYGY